MRSEGEPGTQARGDALAVVATLRGDTLEILCSGELDLASSSTLIDAAKQPVDPASRLILDCTRITFVDSHGINAIMGIAARCRDDGVELTIEPSRQMRRVLEVLGLGAYLGLR